MTITGSLRMAALIAVLSIMSVAQQRSAPKQQTQQTQTQQTQPPQKQSGWARFKKAAQAAQQQVGTNQQQQGLMQQHGQMREPQQQMPMQPQVQQGMQQGVQQVQQLAPGQQGQQQMMMGHQGTGSCGPSCFDAGPFQTSVTQMTMSQQGGWHVIRMNMQSHNATDQPLIIAYHEGSMVMVDNNGKPYVPQAETRAKYKGWGSTVETRRTRNSFLLPARLAMRCSRSPEDEAMTVQSAQATHTT